MAQSFPAVFIVTHVCLMKRVKTPCRRIADTFKSKRFFVSGSMFKKRIQAGPVCVSCDIPASRKIGGFMGHIYVRYTSIHISVSLLKPCIS